jgi:hypothetical protein
VAEDKALVLLRWFRLVEVQALGYFSFDGFSYIHCISWHELGECDGGLEVSQAVMNVLFIFNGTRTEAFVCRWEEIL